MINTTEEQAVEPQAKDITLVLENDPCPIVKIFANKMNNALNDSSFIENVERVQGCFALKSIDGAQSLTINIEGKTISLYSGVKAGAKIVIHTPLSDSGSQKTRVENLWRHPIFANRVGRLLDFPKPSWVDSAKRFWDKNKDYPGMPTGIKLECTDEAREYIIGVSPEASISGHSKELINFLTGENVFVESCIKGKLNSQMSFEHAVVLSDVTLQMLLGER